MGRILLSYIANLLTKFITGLPVMDVTARFKCYKRIVLETIDLESVKSVGYSFQVEMKFLAWKYGFKPKEVPIIFTNRMQGYSKMSHHIIFEAFLKIMRLRIGSIFQIFHRAIK